MAPIPHLLDPRAVRPAFSRASEGHITKASPRTRARTHLNTSHHIILLPEPIPPYIPRLQTHLLPLSPTPQQNRLRRRHPLPRHLHPRHTPQHRAPQRLQPSLRDPREAIRRRSRRHRPADERSAQDQRRLGSDRGVERGDDKCVERGDDGGGGRVVGVGY